MNEFRSKIYLKFKREIFFNHFLYLELNLDKSIIFFFTKEFNFYLIVGYSQEQNY